MFPSFFRRSAAGAPGADKDAPSLTKSVSERLDAESQMHGPLWKKDTSGTSSWTVREFVLKDSFLLYYMESKEGQAFDLHPKGVVPLDGVSIETVRAGPNKSLQSSIRISHASFGMKSVLLCAHDDAERDRWVSALQTASHVTYSRVCKFIGDIEHLKSLGAGGGAASALPPSSVASGGGAVGGAGEGASAPDAAARSLELEQEVVRLRASLASAKDQNRALLSAIARAEATHRILIDLPEVDDDAAIEEDLADGELGGGDASDAAARISPHRLVSSTSRATQARAFAPIAAASAAAGPALAAPVVTDPAFLRQFPPPPLPPPPPFIKSAAAAAPAATASSGASTAAGAFSLPPPPPPKLLPVAAQRAPAADESGKSSRIEATNEGGSLAPR